MAGESNRPSRHVLIVEDERELADIYQQWLEPDFEAKAVYSGEEAVEEIDFDWDAVLLDRRMPGISGDEVLSRIRSKGQEYPVAMVTAVEPDFDIIEMGFDDYVVKPVTKEDLHQTLRRLFDLTDYDSAIKRYFSLASKKATLETNKSQQELKNNAEYQALIQRFEEVEAEVNANRDDLIQERTDKELFHDRLDAS